MGRWRSEASWRSARPARRRPGFRRGKRQRLAVPAQLEIVTVGIRIELEDLDRRPTDGPDLVAPHCHGTEGRAERACQAGGQSLGVGREPLLDHQPPVGQSDELHLVTGHPRCIDRGNCVPLALAGEPRDAGGASLARDRQAG